MKNNTQKIMPQEPILQLNNISHQYNKEGLVLNDLSYEFSNKKYVLMGPSGIGKSTLLHIAGKIIKPTMGTVETTHNFGIIFQTLNLLNDFTLRENIELAARIKKRNIEYEELANLCKLTDILDKYPNQVSGGQRQLCAIVRALATGATFLLADEPTGDLDEQNAQLIRQLFDLLNSKFEMGWLVSSHDSSWLEIADKKLTIKNGILEEL